ncbi:MAG: hypothetical protein DMH00_05105 [Acidobacteria bacterium]|nr:MAG: hypothetical protein DMH00_05105 [Acidobacteriota bacterium]
MDEEGPPSPMGLANVTVELVPGRASGVEGNADTIGLNDLVEHGTNARHLRGVPSVARHYEQPRELVRDGASLVLVVRRTLRVSRREVPAVDFPALKQFLDSLAREEAP